MTRVDDEREFAYPGGVFLEYLRCVEADANCPIWTRLKQIKGRRFAGLVVMLAILMAVMLVVTLAVLLQVR